MGSFCTTFQLVVIHVPQNNYTKQAYVNKGQSNLAKGDIAVLSYSPSGSKVGDGECI